MSPNPDGRIFSVLAVAHHKAASCENLFFAYAKTKTQISLCLLPYCYFLKIPQNFKPKSPSVALQYGLWTWSEPKTPNTGFLATLLNSSFLFNSIHSIEDIVAPMLSVMISPFLSPTYNGTSRPPFNPSLAYQKTEIQTEWPLNRATVWQSAMEYINRILLVRKKTSRYVTHVNKNAIEQK